MTFPFPSEVMKRLTSVLTPEDALEVIFEASSREREWLTRLWISEGIPHAFRKQPALFEACRFWLGTKLNIDPKCITLIGSGRTGFSLSPRKFGRAYNERSDLDFSIVSAALFERLRADAEAWLEDYREGRASVNKHSKDNYRNIPEIIRRGFVDHWKLPVERRYETVWILDDCINKLTANLLLVPEMCRFSKMSFRVYRDWPALIRQAEINYSHTVDKIAKQKVAVRQCGRI